VTGRSTTLYLDSAVLTADLGDGLAAATELGFSTVVVADRSELPDELIDAWHLTTDVPEAGSRQWSRTIVIGPRTKVGRRAVPGIRTARDLRLAVLELASEQALG
jgi:hypothetical protein